MKENIDKIQKLKELQDKIENGNINSNIFSEKDNSEIVSSLSQIERFQTNENEVYDKYSEDRVRAENCKDEPKSKQSPKKAFDYALRILSQRDYSVFKMKEKLKLRDFSKSAIEATIQKLHSYNYLREDEYTRGRIKQLIVKGYANQYILKKLSLEELTAEESVIEDIRVSQELGTESQIVYLIDKKLRGLEIPSEFNLKMKLKDKIIRFLISKGYSFEEIGTHLNEKFK